MNQHHGQSPQSHLYDRTALKTYLKRNESLPVDVFLAYLGAGGGSLVFVLCMAAAVFGSAGQDTLVAGIGALVVAVSGGVNLRFRFAQSHQAGLQPWQSTVSDIATMILFGVLLPVVILAVLLMYVATVTTPNHRL